MSGKTKKNNMEKKIIIKDRQGNEIVLGMEDKFEVIYRLESPTATHDVKFSGTLVSHMNYSGCDVELYMKADCREDRLAAKNED